MSKPKRSIPAKQLKIYISIDVYESLCLLIADPVTGQPRYGATSDIIEKLLRKHLTELGVMTHGNT